MLGSHTPRTALEKLSIPGKNVANDSHYGENHNGHIDKTDQAANVENLGQCAELSPFSHHRYTAFPKHVKFMPTLHAPLLINLNRRDSKNPPHSCDNVGKGQLGFHILTSTFWTLRSYSR